MIGHGFSLSPDAIRRGKTYAGLVLEETKTLPSSLGVKSVLFNPAGTKLYALNLEGGSIYEFSQSEKKISREIVFQRTKARGLDYTTGRAIASFAEKPVEACFVNQTLWVSLHNAGGIIPIFPDSLALNKIDLNVASAKAIVIDLEKQRRDTIGFPLIKTGETPKVIAATADRSHLLVSNWSTKTIAVLKLKDTVAPYGRKIASLKMSATPRGIAIDNENHKSYVAIMGSNTITVINNNTWKVENAFVVPLNPRHIIAAANRLLVSFNAGSQIACINAKTGKVLFKAKTRLHPRTIAVSENQQFLFVTCYEGNTLDIFKINSNSFHKIYSLSCTGKPVGIAIHENEEQLEAWVGNYMAGNLKVFTFKKVY
jgi:DNA-binding beta-propeller fold protein YncE